MTADLLAEQDRPLVGEAPVGAVSLTGATLPDDYDYTRVYVIPGCTTVELERYVHPCGPANPNSRSLADVVKAWVS